MSGTLPRVWGQAMPQQWGNSVDLRDNQLDADASIVDSVTLRKFLDLVQLESFCKGYS